MPRFWAFHRGFCKKEGNRSTARLGSWPLSSTPTRDELGNGGRGPEFHPIDRPNQTPLLARRKALREAVLRCLQIHRRRVSHYISAIATERESVFDRSQGNRRTS